MRDGFRAKEKKGTSRFTDVPHVEVNKAVQYVYPDVDDGGSKGLINKDVSFEGVFLQIMIAFFIVILFDEQISLYLYKLDSEYSEYSSHLTRSK